MVSVKTNIKNALVVLLFILTSDAVLASEFAVRNMVSIEVSSPLRRPPSCDLYLSRMFNLSKFEYEVAEQLKMLSLQEDVKDSDLRDLRLLIERSKIKLPENQTGALVLHFQFPISHLENIQDLTFQRFTLPGLSWTNQRDIFPSIVKITNQAQGINVDLQTSYLYYCLGTEPVLFQIFQPQNLNKVITWKSSIPKNIIPSK